MKHLIDARSAMVARMIAVVVSAALGVAGCGGSATPSSSATPSATPAPAVDACLVGTWTVVAQNQNSPANDEDIAYSGGVAPLYNVITVRTFTFTVAPAIAAADINYLLRIVRMVGING